MDWQDGPPYVVWIVDDHRAATLEQVVAEHDSECTHDHGSARYWFFERALLLDRPHVYANLVAKNYEELGLQLVGAAPGGRDVLVELLREERGVICLACTLDAPFTEVDKIDEQLLKDLEAIGADRYIIGHATGPFPISTDEARLIAAECVDLGDPSSPLHPPSWVKEVIEEGDE